MKGQKPELGRSQGRGARHERSAAKRASILDGSPSGGYKRQHRLQRGAPLYCVDSTVGDVVQLVRTLPRHWLESYTVTDKVAGRKPVPRTFYLAAAPRRARVRDTSLRNLRS